LSYARREELFAPGDRVLVAVSGGPDSVALLHLLHRLKGELEVELGVAHFDHRLRGRQSREDAAFVADLAQGLGLPFHPGAGEVKALAQAEKISLQMAGRKLRHSFFQALRRSHAYTKIALGHTADDQVELFFLRLLRGAGPEGLQGMRPATPGGLVRPLLGVAKDTILAWLRREALAYREDPSNRSRNYLRNRIRLDLLPALTSRYNPRLREAICRTQALLEEDERLLSREAQKHWRAVGRELAPGFFSLDLPGLLALDPAFQKRLIRLTLAKLLGEWELSSARTESLLALARGARSGGVIHIGEARVARAGRGLHFFRGLPPPPGEAATLLPAPPAEVESPEGWRWHLAERAHPSENPRPPSPLTAWLDRDKVTFPLQARYFRQGDRFWPDGAPGKKKLQDFLVDSKVPRWLRPYLPLVTSAGRLVWVAGLRVAEPVKVTPASRTILEIRLAPAHPDTGRIWAMLSACREKRE
jgi:tRNA(Ile)-lysidine synthase